MDHLIEASIELLVDNPDHQEAVRIWITDGDEINRAIVKGRHDSIKEYQEVAEILKRLICIPLQEEVTMYRRVKGVVNNLQLEQELPAQPFTSLTHLEEEVNPDFGENIMRIILPKGTLAFYISAYDIHVLGDIKEERSEYETIIHRGSFIYYGYRDGYYDFTYKPN